jgi:hypothetical protein
MNVRSQETRRSLYGGSDICRINDLRQVLTAKCRANYGPNDPYHMDILANRLRGRQRTISYDYDAREGSAAIQDIQGLYR